jgi:hypothetical protein
MLLKYFSRFQFISGADLKLPYRTEQNKRRKYRTPFLKPQRIKRADEGGVGFTETEGRH